MNALDDRDYSPLHRAAGMNHDPAMIAALLEAGAEIEAWAKGFDVDYGWDETPLHEAAGANPNPAVAALLIEAGADIDARGLFWDERGGGSLPGRTPLHAAAIGNPAVFVILLEAGADPAALDEHGKSPMDIARESRALRELEVVKRFGS